MLSILTRVLPVLLPLAWLLVTVVVIAACRSAARSDAAGQGSQRRTPRVRGGEARSAAGLS